MVLVSFDRHVRPDSRQNQTFLPIGKESGLLRRSLENLAGLCQLLLGEPDRSFLVPVRSLEEFRPYAYFSYDRLYALAHFQERQRDLAASLLKCIRAKALSDRRIYKADTPSSDALEQEMIGLVSPEAS